MAYSREKFREKLRTAIGSIDSFYAEPLLNYRGKCSDTGERYEDVATAFVLENLSALENIKTAITQNANEVEIKYVSKEEELEKIMDWLGEESNLLDVYNNSENNPLLASLEIKASTNKEIQSIVEAIQDMPGIYNTNTYINQNPYELFLFQVFNG